MNLVRINKYTFGVNHTFRKSKLGTYNFLLLTFSFNKVEGCAFYILGLVFNIGWNAEVNSTLNKVISNKQGFNHWFTRSFEYEILFKQGKSVNPIRNLKNGEYLVFFDIVWSNDTSLMAATHLGGLSNHFKDYCYRIQFKNPTSGNFEYCYTIKPYSWLNDNLKNYIP
jgi:hypothetical protein